MALQPTFDEIKNRVTIPDLMARLGAERRGPSNWVCPACGSGNGPHKSAAFSVEPNGRQWRCFSCGASGDAFDLMGIVDKTENRMEQRKAVCDLMGIPTNDQRGPEIDSKGRKPQSTGSGARETRKPERTQMRGQSEEIEKFQAAQKCYLADCAAAFPGSEGQAYMEKRGFAPGECSERGIGWDAAHKCVTFPYGPNSWAWVSRSVVTDESGKKCRKPKLPQGLRLPCHNETAITLANDADGMLWVVEGAIDALAVEVAEHHAVALVGTANSALVPALEGFHGHVIIGTDSDDPGRAAAKKLQEALTARGIICSQAGQWPDAKDPGEVWQREGGRGELGAFLVATEERIRREDEQRRKDAAQATLEELGVTSPIKELVAIKTMYGFHDPLPTGIEAIDAAIGGLPDGLTVLGATSSTGKTTLCVQVADHAAASGHPVLYVAIEQGPTELVAKSLSRIIYEQTGDEVGTRELLSIKERATWSLIETQQLDDAGTTYADTISPNLSYLSPTGQPGVQEIRAAAESMAVLHDGTPPLVIVDYLQLLAPANERQTEKQAVDRNVMALRQMSRDLKTPVMLISSLNRASYSGEVSMDSFKESGGIEYGSDLLLGLQPAHIGEANDGDEAYKVHKVKAVRECELTVLKNRMGGIPGGPIELTFRAISCKFESGYRRF